jgi:predicted RNase H-like HicB family nuclease
MRYPVVIHKDRKSDYGVTVPDLPGCFSAGETMEEALTHAVEAIECHLEGLLLDGDEIPQAQPIEKHLKNRDLCRRHLGAGQR